MSDKQNNEVIIPEKFRDLVTKIESLNVVELSELVKVLEDKFGVSAAMPSVAAQPQSADSTAAAEEKTIFNVELKSAGDNKIQVIKAVKDLLGIGLKDAKDFVDAAPKILKESVKKEEAEEIKKKFAEAGAAVELK